MADEEKLTPEVQQDIDKLTDMFGEEALHPDIVPYVRKSDNWEQILHHKFYIAIPYWPQLNKMINRTIEHKTKVAAEAVEQRKWTRYLGLHERPYRVDAFLGIADSLTDEEYWDEVSWLWTDSENIHEYRREWRKIWRAKRVGRDRVMDADEKAVLAGLPEKFTVYRGTFIFPDGFRGMSWTINRDKAVWFAHRYKPAKFDPWLISGTVSKRSVIAYLDNRNEAEIVVLPEHVRNHKIEQLPERERPVRTNTPTDSEHRPIA